MSVVRAATPADVRAVAELLTRVEPRAPDVEVAERRVADVFFDHPWRDEAVPSLLAVDEAGKLQGFLGVIPRPMVIGARLVSVATGVRLAVDPTCREFVGLRLLRRFLDGPQDVSVVDGAGCATRALWERLGGTAALPYSLAWTRPLRPAALALRRGGRRLGRLAALVGFAGTLVDAIAVRSRLAPFPRYAGSGGQEVDDDRLARCLDGILGRRGLHARYDAASLAWVLARARERVGGVLHRIVVPGRGSAPVGAYVLAVRPGDTAEVLLMALRGDTGDRVLRDVLARASDAGCVAVAGQADLRLVTDLTDRRCLLHTARRELLVHARDPDVRRDVERGNAALGRLDGDWWVPV